MPAIKLKKVTAEYLAEKESKEKMKEKTKKNLEDVAEEENKTSEDETKTVPGGKTHNFLEVEILFDKRKRVPPPAEQKLTDWLDSNLMAKEDVNLPLTTLYEYYSEVCQMQGEPVVDVPVFNRYIRDKFGKSFGFQENSPYRVLIKERKVKEKKPKVEGETMQIKIRDIITNVINDLGNPTKGLRFQIISKTIVQKYPAKRVDLYPNKLKSGLERGVMYGYIERVRGVGMCGYYRVPGKPTKEEVDEKKNKKKHSTETTGEEGEDEAKEGSVENGDTGDNNVDDNKDDNEGKSTDDEKKDDNNDDKKTDDDKPDDKTDPETEEKSDKTSKVKKTLKKKKKKPVEQWAKSNLAKHSDPDKVEDVFPLAITYQTDPKQATGSKIKSYISKFYRVEVSNDRLRKALDNGVEKGLWELTSGSAPNGRYHLLVESFYPGRSDSLKDQIAQALVACNEPKQASAGLIKKYITKYHPKLNVESRPHLFKHALERACMKGNITQLSGIGASGTFELKDHFYPSPAILAGDSSDSEEEDVDDDSDNQVPEYVPRPTKRTKSAPKPKPSSRSVTLPAKKMKPSISPKPVEKKKEVAKSKNSRGARNAKKTAIIEVSDSSDVDEPAEYTPRPTKRRGGSSSTPLKKKATPSTTISASKRGRAAVASTPKKGTNKVKPSKSTTVVESDDGVEEEEETGMEYTPRPTKSRNAAAKPTPEPSKSTSRSRGGKRAIIEHDADDESEEEIISPPKKRKNIKIDVNTEAKKTTPAKYGSKRRR